MRLQSLTFFEYAFEPATILLSSSSSPYFFSSAPSSPHLFFKCALEPSPPSSAPSSPRPSFWERLRALIFFLVRLWALTSFFSAHSSPHLLQVRLEALTSFWVRLPALDHPFECTFEPLFSFESAFEPSPPSSAPSSPHFLSSALLSPYLFF